MPGHPADARSTLVTLSRILTLRNDCAQRSNVSGISILIYRQPVTYSRPPLKLERDEKGLYNSFQERKPSETNTLNLKKSGEVNRLILILTAHLLTHASSFENIRVDSASDVSAG